MLDFLFTEYASSASSSGSNASSRQRLISSLRVLAQRDLGLLIDSVVPPDSWEGIKLNSSVTSQILHSWRLKRLFLHEQITEILQSLEQRRQNVSRCSSTQKAGEHGATDPSSLTKDDVIRRIEEDRERHKSIREKLWVLPPKSYVDAVPDQATVGTDMRIAAVSSSPATTLCSDRPAKRIRLGTNQESSSDADTLSDSILPVSMPSIQDIDDIQFDELWETTSDLNDDDLIAWREEIEERWWGSEKILSQRKAETETIVRQEETLRKKRKEDTEARTQSDRRREQRALGREAGKCSRDFELQERNGDRYGRASLTAPRRHNNSTAGVALPDSSPSSGANNWPKRRQGPLPETQDGGSQSVSPSNGQGRKGHALLRGSDVQQPPLASGPRSGFGSRYADGGGGAVRQCARDR